MNFYPVFKWKRGELRPREGQFCDVGRDDQVAVILLPQCGLNHQGTSKWVSWQNGHLTAHLPVWSTGKWYLILIKPNRQIIAQWTCPNWTFLRTILPYWIKGPNRIGCQQTQPIRTPYGMNKLSQDSLKLVRRYFFLLWVYKIFKFLYFHECVES